MPLQTLVGVPCLCNFNLTKQWSKATWEVHTDQASEGPVGKENENAHLHFTEPSIIFGGHSIKHTREGDTRNMHPSLQHRIIQQRTARKKTLLSWATKNVVICFQGTIFPSFGAGRKRNFTFRHPLISTDD
jgi:hypothetical protein